MSETPRITGRDIIKIAACLAVTCLLAGVILGAAYYFTEPVRQAETARSESQLIRTLLELKEGGEVIEVRRYIREMPTLDVAYLMSGELQVFDGDGKLEKSVPVPASLAGKSADDLDKWVKDTTGEQYVGRFFVGKMNGKVAGYVTESSHYGFKSNIRFFVALTPDFQVRGVEVTSLEEDPGLGAEVAKPAFHNQFVGRIAETLSDLSVTKDPMPDDRRAAAMARDTMSFEDWVKQYGAPKTPIYAVTGATISSRGLTEGVKEAVANLKYRLHIVKPEGRHE